GTIDAETDCRRAECEKGHITAPCFSANVCDVTRKEMCRSCPVRSQGCHEQHRSDNQRNARYRQRTGHTGDHVTDDAETENDKRADWDARVTGFRSTRRNQPPRRKAENQRLSREHPEQQTPITVLGENPAKQWPQ